jgi:hypothetical protein
MITIPKLIYTDPQVQVEEDCFASLSLSHTLLQLASLGSVKRSTVHGSTAAPTVSGSLSGMIRDSYPFDHLLSHPFLETQVYPKTYF